MKNSAPIDQLSLPIPDDAVDMSQKSQFEGSWTKQIFLRLQHVKVFTHECVCWISQFLFLVWALRSEIKCKLDQLESDLFAIDDMRVFKITL